MLGCRRSVELVEAREIRPCLPNRVGRHAGETGYLQAVALVRGAVGDFVQEHDSVLVLDRVEMDVGAALDLGGQRGQLEVVCREQREAAIAARELARDRPGE